MSADTTSHQIGFWRHGINRDRLQELCCAEDLAWERRQQRWLAAAWVAAGAAFVLLVALVALLVTR